MPSIISLVIWLQGGLCFLFWIAYGVIQNRRSEAIRTWALTIPRQRRTLLAAAFMIGSVAIMFGVLATCLRLNGFTKEGMAGWVCLVVGVFGLLFVHGQTMATALLVATVQESVTSRPSDSSNNL